MIRTGRDLSLQKGTWNSNQLADITPVAAHYALLYGVQPPPALRAALAIFKLAFSIVQGGEFVVANSEV
jgi:hypothetical protein